MLKEAITVEILMMNYISYNYQDDVSLEHILRDMKCNDYFGEDTEHLMKVTALVFDDVRNSQV